MKVCSAFNKWEYNKNLENVFNDGDDEGAVVNAKEFINSCRQEKET